MKGAIVFFLIGATFLSLQFDSDGPTDVVIGTPIAFPDMPVNDNNRLTKEGIELGRRLFYDPILSGNGTFSCASCHKQEFAFSDGKTKGIGIHGETLLRNTPGLFNLAWYPQLFWDGRSNSLESQVFEPVRKHDEMDVRWTEVVKRLKNDDVYRDLFEAAFGTSQIDSVKVAFAIAQFEHSMISANAKFDQVLRGEKYLTESEYRGFVIMNDQNKGNCLHCHTSDGNALGTTG